MNRIPLCCHRMPTGVHCQSPALKTSGYCHAHLRVSKRRHVAQRAVLTRQQAEARQAAAAQKRRDEYAPDFTAIEDRATFLAAVGRITQALAADQVSHRRAGCLLDQLQRLQANLSQ